ncbi:4a-hydroxytetrahydrobiopterin dehydratase [Phytoactinopolyspora alkaliphila]|uniref:Putative pterin-4-alpha-carbinolamine dehydratase n=1 Tax=Phytoactinopolyspora alkaliphila TaxID=1783498 RepID=A0A6N9YNQ7_9ACTN|nr:VOC family protein [Phytoactinopolyspora alkaliphila]NED96575.1 4a-hydroxytetrahydrobiopterin dehydratase [Phytoactinopolyspora alkaliphila]
MSERADGPERELSRHEASAAVLDLGWRYVLGTLRTTVPVASIAHAADVAALAIDVARSHADEHLRIDLRRDRVVFTLQSLSAATVTARDTDLAERISSAVTDLELRTTPDVGDESLRSVQIIEIAIDAMDIPTVRPFWKAILGYDDEPGRTGPADPLVDPLGQSPAIWFQQMDESRPQRNRIHLDISVPHDEAQHRIAAALSAGGTLRSDANAPAFWVLADAEGNEACITTWQGRDG